MNNTNRALNRFGVFVFGLVLVAVGTAAALAVAVPDWFDGWKAASSAVEEQSPRVIRTTTVEVLGQSWLLALIPAICILLIVLLIAFIVRQGNGRTAILLTESVTAPADDPGAGGSVTVDAKVAERVIQHALDEYPALVSSTVSTYRVGRVPALKITANVRRGVSPRVVRAFIDETVVAWDAVLGREVPVLIQLNAGLATRIAKTTRVSTTDVD